MPGENELPPGDSTEDEEDEDEEHELTTLTFLLYGVVTTNDLKTDNLIVADALFVLKSGQHRLYCVVREVNRYFKLEVKSCLCWMIGDSPIHVP